MTTTFTGNVILTTSRAVIDRLFFNKTSITVNDIFSSLTEEEVSNSIICSPSRNTNLISFDYNFNGDQKSGHLLKIRFVETGSLFEEYYLNRDIDSEIASDILKGLKDKKNTLGPRNTAAIESSFISRKGLVTSDYIYFSFGVGPNLDDWAGPFMANLVRAEMFIGENGIREIEMTFVAQSGFLMRNILESNRAKQFETAINRYDFITKKQPKPVTPKKVELEADYTFLNTSLSAITSDGKKLFERTLNKDEPIGQLLNSQLLNQNNQRKIIDNFLNNSKQKFNYIGKECHRVITELIRSYIYSLVENGKSIYGYRDPNSTTMTVIAPVRAGNIMVVLPDLSEAIESELLEYFKNKSNLISLYIAFENTNNDQNDKFIYEFNKFLLYVRDILNKYTSFYCQAIMSRRLDAIKIEKELIKGRTSNSDIENNLIGDRRSQNRKAIDSVSGSFEFLGGYDLYAELWDNNRLTEQERSNRYESLDTVDGKGAALDTFAKLVRLHGIELELTVNSNEKDRSLETTTDYYIPLTKFNNAISPLISKLGISYDPIFMVENDIRILNLWKKLKIIDDQNYPVYIFGDSNLINKAIYLSDVRSVEQLVQPSNLLLDDLNKIYFSNTNYRTLFYSVFNDTSFNSSFKEDVFEQDELAIFQDPQTRALTQLGRYPVFRYNVRNPNVLAVSFQNLNAYRAVYDIGFQYKTLGAFVNATSEFYLDSLSSTQVNDFDFLVKYIEAQNAVTLINADFKDILKTVITFFDSDNIPFYFQTDFTDKFGTPIDKNELSTYIAAAIFRKLNGPDVPYIDANDPNELISLQEELRRGLNRFTNFLNIRTLPFFKMSGTKTFAYPALFVGMTNGAGTNEKKSAFFTGLYQINGFRHVITPKDMYSEFSLIKNQDSSIFKNVLDENLNKVDAEPALKPSGP